MTSPKAQRGHEPQAAGQPAIPPEFFARIDELVDDSVRLQSGATPESVDSAVWGLHARVHRAVSDYIGQVAGRDVQGSGAILADGIDPYTLLIVKATLRRARYLPPLVAMAYSRPFCPPFEAIEDALLKPLVHEAMDTALTPAEREMSIIGLLADWIPDITQDVGTALRDWEEDQA